jgi:hypothetical protein
MLNKLMNRKWSALVGALALLGGLGEQSARAAEPEAADLPEIIAAASAGDWLVDRFAGNSTAGPTFFQGPAREVAGLGRCGACPLPDGRVLIPFPDGIAEVDTNGTLRLVAETRVLFATTAQVTANVMAYNPTDRRVYIAGPNCVRRLSERHDGPWQIELVAGTPGRAGFADGPANAATFTRIDSLVSNSRGTIFLLDFNQRLRQIEQGQVTTLNSAIHSGECVDGPLAQAKFNLIGLGGNLCGGEDDHTLYLSDHWNFVVRKINLRTSAVSTVAGMPKPNPERGVPQDYRQRRYNRNSDGPALTWASFNSGCAYVCWDPVHRALWCGGPDENRFRWLKDGQVQTVIGAKGGDRWPKDGLAVPAEQVRLTWNAVVAVDAQGRAYLSCSGEPHGLWRAYPRPAVKP